MLHLLIDILIAVLIAILYERIVIWDAQHRA